jgi:hypothetical protein
MNAYSSGLNVVERPDALEVEAPGEDRELRAAGRELAQSIRSLQPHGRRGPRPRPGQAQQILAGATAASDQLRRWAIDNARLLRTAEKQAIEFAVGLRQFPVAETDSASAPRVVLLARAYLDRACSQFDEAGCVAFLEGFQEVATLEMGELWALKPALQREILNRLEAERSNWPELITSLRHIGETAWKDLFESVSMVERVLAGDPSGAYPRMDFDSRDAYRNVIGSLAKHSPLSEREVAEAAVELAASVPPQDSRAVLRRRHVGFYLVDSGLPQMQKRIQYEPPAAEKIVNAVRRRPTAFFLAGIEIATFLIVSLLVPRAGLYTPTLAAIFLLLLPATQTAVDFMNHLVTHFVSPRALPKLDFSEGVPADCATMVAVPTLLLNEAQVRDLALDLEIRFLANRDPNLYFALVTDSPDSDAQVDERDALVDVATELIETLNSRYRGSPFFLFHRRRIYNDSEGRFMGWERKRGKLLDLNQLICGGFDACSQDRQARGLADNPVCHHARFRYAVAARYCQEADRRHCASVERRCGSPGAQNRSGGVWNPAAPNRNQHQLGGAQPFGRVVLGGDRVRYLHPRRLRRLPGPLRGRHLYGEGHLRSRRFPGRLAGAFPRKRAPEPRPNRGGLCAGRPRQRYRADRRLPLALQRVQSSKTPVGARRLADHAVGAAAGSGPFG